MGTKLAIIIIGGFIGAILQHVFDVQMPAIHWLIGFMTAVAATLPNLTT